MFDIRPKTYKIIIALVELFLGIPFVGGIYIISHGWKPLAVLFLCHILGIFIANRNYRSILGHVLGVGGNALAWIPFLGWISHLIVGIVLLIEGLNDI